jgi:hypothetical protein
MLTIKINVGHDLMAISRAKHLLLSAIIMAILTTGCQSQRVITDYDPSGKFSNYKHYDLQAHHSRPHSIPQQKLHSALERQLPSKGLVASNAQFSADVNVKYELQLDSYQSSGINPQARIGLGGGNRGVGYGVSLGFPLFGGTKNRTDAVVNIDIFDARTGQLVWWAEKNISWNEAKPSAQSSEISAAVDAMLSKYPPGTSGSRLFFW